MTPPSLPLEGLLWAALHPRAGGLGRKLDALVEAWSAEHLGAALQARADRILDHPGGPLIPFTLPVHQRRSARIMLAAFLDRAPRDAEAVIHSHGALAGMGHLRVRRTGEAEFLERLPGPRKAPRLTFDARALERLLESVPRDPMTSRLVPDASGILLRIGWPVQPGEAEYHLESVPPPGCAAQFRGRGFLLPGGPVRDDPRAIHFRITRPEPILRFSALAETGPGPARMLNGNETSQWSAHDVRGPQDL